VELLLDPSLDELRMTLEEELWLTLEEEEELWLTLEEDELWLTSEEEEYSITSPFIATIYPDKFRKF
jgi:hypothetical protein